MQSLPDSLLSHVCDRQGYTNLSVTQVYRECLHTGKKKMKQNLREGAIASVCWQ